MSTTAVTNIQVFTDFDGTLSLDDTGILLIDDHRSMGPEKRRELEHLILEGKITYRDGLQQMWNSVKISWEEAWAEYLDKCRIDPGFPEFYNYCLQKGYPVTVVSSGLRPLLDRIMDKFLGDKAKEIDIVSNDCKVRDRSWSIIWHDDSVFGNDKSQTLIQARERAPQGTVFVFCGDGVSDISAAKHADILFARKGRDLETYCRRENIPFVAFDTFKEIHEVVQNLADGKVVLKKDGISGFCQLVNV